MALLGLSFIILTHCFMRFIYGCNAQNCAIKFPAIFVFGDSLMDTGNNNYLNTFFKANYSPYGIDFPGGIPTGRYSDGKLIPDIVASMLGIEETVSPFLKPDLSDDEIRRGVCFASAAAGLDNQTLSYTGQINMLDQPDYLAAYVQRLKKIVGEEEARRIVGEALVIIGAGHVDFIYNYYFIRTNRSLEFTVLQYQDFLLNNMQVLIKSLYNLGCRRMSIAGLGPMGCVPLIMTVNSPQSGRKCQEKVNSDAQIYNKKLSKLLAEMQPKLPGTILVYGDSYTPLMELIKNPKQHGFVESGKGCCGTGLVESGLLCNITTQLCKNPHEYVFCDVFHTSESANLYISKCMVEKLRQQIFLKCL